MKKLIKNILNNKLYVCTFIISLLIIGIIYQINEVTPFGKHSLLCVDFYHQYGPMMKELYEVMHGNANHIYSFQMAMGLPFFRNFLNYLSSPFNLIMLLFTRKGLLTSYSFIIGLKAVASSTTMVYYLSKKFKTKELFLIPLGIIYAFSGYFQAYYWNIMWLDGMVFLPLITLGIEYLVNENKWKFYSIFLCIMLLANYFIGYMICIYAGVYFLLYSLYKIRYKKEYIINDIKTFYNKCALFFFASLIGGVLSFFLLIPLLSSMQSISATGGGIPDSQYYSFKLIDYLLGHFTGVKNTVFASDEITNPNITCGILSIALLFVYFTNTKISLKNKICYLLLLSFVIAAFFNPVLDFIFQAFHVPNDLPYRYSFIYSFILIVICAYSLINLRKQKYIVIVFCYILIMALLMYLLKINWPDLKSNMIFINMILLTLYFIFYSGLYFFNNMKIIFYGSLIIVSAIDVIVGVNYNWNITQEMNVFYQDYEATEKLLNYVKDYDDGLFYRIENTQMMTLNDASWYGYNGMTTFSSMAYENMAVLNHNLGMPGNEINSYYYVEQTPIYDLMFDIKYFIGNSNDFKRYKEIKTIDETANEFIYNVGLGYGVNKNIKSWNNTSLNPFEIQNDFIYKSTGIENVLEESKIRKVESLYENNKTILKYYVKNNYDNLYFYASSTDIDYFIIGSTLYYNNENYRDYTTTINDELTYISLDNYDEEKIINIHSEDEEIIIYVCYNYYYDKNFELYEINNDKFIEVYNILKNNKLDITKFKENIIEGNITLYDDQIIYTSIPYDKGWHVYIDGKEAKTDSLADTLLLVEASEGTHKIKFVYKIPYFKESMSASLIALFILVISTLIDKKIIKIKKLKI